MNFKLTREIESPVVAICGLASIVAGGMFGWTFYDCISNLTERGVNTSSYLDMDIMNSVNALFLSIACTYVGAKFFTDNIKVKKPYATLDDRASE